MGRYWKIKCPYCNAELASGGGYGDKIPDVWLPFIRCKVCCKLVLTGSNEYLTMPYEERLKLRKSQTNIELIRQSLDRTNNSKYLDLLKNNGYDVYPVGEADSNRFTSINFEQLINQEASKEATQSLYDSGVLIKEEMLDQQTGEVKQDIIDKNIKDYNNGVTAVRWGTIVGFILGIISCILFASINPNSYLFLLGVPIGFGGFALTGHLIEKHQEKENSNSTQDSTSPELQSTIQESPKEIVDNQFSYNKQRAIYIDEDEDDSSAEVSSSLPYNDTAFNGMNEKKFAEGQRVMGGFFPDWSFNKEKYVALVAKKEKYGILTADEESRLIFPLIFGAFDCEIDLDKAQSTTEILLSHVMQRKPTENQVRENDVYMDWLHDYAVAQILLGTIFSYKHEYVKAAYHFMLGLKTEQIGLNRPYTDFMMYIFAKLPPLVTEETNFSGCGFSKDNPMGSCGGDYLNANLSMMTIAEMEGNNGEVVVARLGHSGLYGHLERKGSTYSEKLNTMLDIYETYIIDTNYQIKKMVLFFNGYFPLTKGKIKLASGFKIKSHSVLLESEEFLSEI